MRELGYPTMHSAHDFVVAEDGTLYVATVSHPQLGSAIQEWDLATGELRRHFGRYDELARATSVALGADGMLYACDYERDRVMRFDPATGASLGPWIDEHLRAPVSIDFGLDGRFYVLDAAGLHRFDAETGGYLGALVTVDGETLRRPLGFTFVPASAVGPIPRAIPRRS